MGQPDWSENSHSIALTIESPRERLLHHLIFNAYGDSLNFELPQVPDAGENPWRRWIDTALDSPADILSWDTAVPASGHVYRVAAHSVVVLFARV